MKVFEKVRDSIHKVSNAIVWVSAISLLFISVLIFIDVFCRYVIKSPILGAQEITQMAIMVVVYMGLPCATLRRRHIRVDALINKFKEVPRLICLGCTSLIVIVYSAPACYFLLKQSITLFQTMTVTTQILKIPHAPFYLIAAFGCFQMTLEFLLDGIRYFKEAYEAKQKLTGKENC
jgi:TRAP-type C4-dicarboxylate transport system permease small subunit